MADSAPLQKSTGLQPHRAQTSVRLISFFSAFHRYQMLHLVLQFLPWAQTHPPPKKDFHYSWPGSGSAPAHTQMTPSVFSPYNSPRALSGVQSVLPADSDYRLQAGVEIQTLLSCRAGFWSTNAPAFHPTRGFFPIRCRLPPETSSNLPARLKIPRPFSS